MTDTKLTQEEIEELKKEAQRLLLESSKIRNEAAALAERGGFVLYVGEIGVYYPKAIFNDNHFRQEAEFNARKYGRTSWPNWDATKHTRNPDSTQLVESFDSLSSDDQEVLVVKLMHELKRSSFDDYSEAEGGDYAEPGWWSPSRC